MDGNHPNAQGSAPSAISTTGGHQSARLTGLSPGTSYDIYAALGTSNTLSDKLVVTTLVATVPVLTGPVPDLLGLSNTQLSHDISEHFAHPAGGSLSFSAADLPDGLEISAEGVISGTVTDEVDAVVTVTAANSLNETVTSTLTIKTFTSRTTATVVGEISADNPGVSDVELTTLSITENFASAMDSTGGSIRIIAPEGITFVETHTLTGTAAAASVSVHTTENTDDTLVISGIASTDGVDTFSITPRAIITQAAPTGLVGFQLRDGGMQDSDTLNITEEVVNLLYVGSPDALDAGADVALAGGYVATRGITGGVPPYAVTTNDTGVASVTISGSTLSITGAAAGSTTVTVTDARNATDSLEVTIFDPAPLPARVTTDVNGNPSTAVVSGAASTDGGVTYTNTVTAPQHVNIRINIAPTAAHVGQSAEVVIVVQIGGQLLSLNEDGVFLPFNEYNLVSFRTISELQVNNEMTVFDGVLMPADVGQYIIYAGYVPGAFVANNIIYNAEGIDLTVQ